MDDLEGMEVAEITAEHPKKGTQTYKGVRLNALLDVVKPKAEATMLTLIADDGYTADVALSDGPACADCLVAFREGGGLMCVAVP